MPALLAAPALADAEDSLARLLPADTGLYVELNDAPDLLALLTEPQIWTTLAELAGQPATPAEAAVWRSRVERTVGMPPEEAIRVLFARQVAFAGTGPGRAQDAVVLCRIPPAESQRLLKAWGATPLQGIARRETYQLYGNIGAAVAGDALLFGDLSVPEGYFFRVLNFDAPPAETLAGDAMFAALRRRVGVDADGLLFARLHAERAPATQPATQAASAPAADGASAVLLGLRREGPRLNLTYASDAPAPTREANAEALFWNLPASTLAAWQGSVDYAAVFESTQTLPERNAVRILAGLPGVQDIFRRFERGLRSGACVALGRVAPATEGAPPIPAIGVLLPVKDAEQAESALEDLLATMSALYETFALASGARPLPPAEAFELDGRPARRIDLSGLTEALGAPVLRPLQLCWQLDDDRLIVASHVDWLREIVAAQRAGGQTLSDAAATRGLRRGASASTRVWLDADAASALGVQWLEYLERTAPDVLTEQWWRSRQPGGAVRIGVDVQSDPEHRRLKITRVLPGSPASGLLEVGEYIVGCEGERFSSEDLLAETRAAIENRPNARWVSLLVVRDNVTLIRRIPVPFVDPIQSLRRLTAIGRIAQRFYFHDDLRDRDGARGHLVIDLRVRAEPVASQSATQPSGS